MLGLEFQKSEKYFERLGSERVVATQLVGQGDGFIRSRTFEVYTFADTAQIKKINEKPPFWAGVIPNDPSTYTNPITEEVNFYYIVKSGFRIDKYEGYLMWAMPIENIDELKEQERLPEGFIDPNDVNVYKGWFKSAVNLFSYDYYLPLKTGTEFRWEVELITKELSIPNLYDKGTLDKVGGSGGTLPSDSFDDKVAEQVQFYEEDGYDVEIIDNSTQDMYITNLVITKNIFNTGGVNLISYNLTTNKTVFEIQKDRTGVSINFTLRNCKVWLSTDGVQESKLIFNSHNGVLINIPKVNIETIKEYSYIIIQPNLIFTESLIGYPPIKFDPLVNTGFTFIAEFIGRHYLHFKEEVDEVEGITEKELIPSGVVNINNPEPPVTIHEYEFVNKDSGWDAEIVF